MAIATKLRRVLTDNSTGAEGEQREATARLRIRFQPLPSCEKLWGNVRQLASLPLAVPFTAGCANYECLI